MSSGLILIRGIGHSGTTILDLSLGVHSKMMGLGEAMRLLRQPDLGKASHGPIYLRGDGRFKRYCTCGALAVNCPLWGPMLEWLINHDVLPLERKLDQLLLFAERHSAVSGQLPCWLVESYQADIQSPDWVAKQLGRPVRVIFLVRDVRSWIYSKVRRAKGPLPGFRALLHWWRVNRSIEEKLHASRCPVFQMGYEEFALEPEATLKRLCNWLSLPFEEAMLYPGETSSSHILSGNRMRFDPKRRASICYDGAWLTSRLPAISLALTIPSVAAMNRRLVYSGCEAST